MNFFDEISKRYKIFINGEASNIDFIKKLKDFSPVPIPEEYFEIIRNKTEIEINVKNMDYIRIWGADNSIEMNNGYYIQKYIPNSIAIGDDEGEYVLLYADGKEGFGLYIVEFGNLDVDEMKYVSRSLKDLLLKGIGVDVLVNS